MRQPGEDPRDEPDGGRAAERLKEFLEQRFDGDQLDHSGESGEDPETEDGGPDDLPSAGDNTRE
jgi:hypothetical protein